MKNALLDNRILPGRSIGLLRWYIKMAITIMNIINRPIFRRQTTIPDTERSYNDWVQLSSLYLKTEIESSLRKVMF
jgi:hypothetical protein